MPWTQEQTKATACPCPIPPATAPRPQSLLSKELITLGDFTSIQVPCFHLNIQSLHYAFFFFSPPAQISSASYGRSFSAHPHTLYLVCFELPTSFSCLSSTIWNDLSSFFGSLPYYLLFLYHFILPLFLMCWFPIFNFSSNFYNPVKKFSWKVHFIGIKIFTAKLSRNWKAVSPIRQDF